jgi:negative regulator of flagellin synthesis FlgM
MKVNQSTSSPIQGNEAKAAKAAGKAQASKAAEKAPKGTEPRDTSSVKTEVSERAREMATAKAAAVNAPEVREEKIAALKARIAAGKYEVDGKAVADRMVDEHIRMSGIG